MGFSPLGRQIVGRPFQETQVLSASVSDTDLVSAPGRDLVSREVSSLDRGPRGRHESCNDSREASAETADDSACTMS